MNAQYVRGFTIISLQFGNTSKVKAVYILEMSFYVFIITSRDNPLYGEFDKMRRLVLEHHGIPHKFLINGALPEGYQFAPDEQYFEDASFTPGMFWKFFHGCKDLLANGACPDYIIRVNSSTFLNFDVIKRDIIPRLPKERCLAGPFFKEPHSPIPFVSGTVMIFSRDVIADLLTVPHNHPFITQHADDESISYILFQKGYQVLQLNEFLIVYYAVTSREYKIYLPDHAAFIRVKNMFGDRFSNDTYVWRELMRLSGFLEITK
jgi:hypothetical protein